MKGFRGEETPIEYEYDQRLNILHVHPFGNISNMDITNYFKDVAVDDQISNGFNEVVYFERVEEFIFSSDQVGNMAMAFNEF